MARKKLIHHEISWYSIGIYLFIAVFCLFKTVFLCGLRITVVWAGWLRTRSSCLSRLHADYRLHDHNWLLPVLCMQEETGKGVTWTMRTDYSPESEVVSVLTNSKGKSHLHAWVLSQVCRELSGSAQLWVGYCSCFPTSEQNKEGTWKSTWCRSQLMNGGKNGTE